MGTMATTEDGEYVQCHECGELFGHLGAHVWQKHGLRAREYKEKYGLYLKRSLSSPKTRERYIQMFNSRPEIQKHQARQGLAKARAKKKNFTKEFAGVPLEKKNLDGRCPDQLIEKIQALALKMEENPSLRDFMAEYGQGYRSSVETTFGSWSEAVSQAGLREKERWEDLETAIRRIEVFAEKHGRQPSYADFDSSEMLPTNRVVRRLFGGVKNARKVVFKED